MSSKSEAKKAIEEFEYMRYKAEAMAWSKLSLERPLTKAEFDRYKEVCKNIGIEIQMR